jgi:endonuclease YncB( thermonuclease family)
MRKGLFILAGTAGLVAILALVGPPEPKRPGAPNPAAAAGQSEPPLRGDLRPALDLIHQQAEKPRIRDVTSEGITPGPAVRGPLVRVEPPTPPPPAAEVAPPKPRTERLFSAIVVAAGRIRAREQDIHLAGLVAPDFQARCGEGEAAWPCGRVARAALRRFVRGRAIECVVPPGAEAVPERADCSVAGTNLSEWLVAQGWARKDGDRYAALEERARERQGSASGAPARMPAQLAGQAAEVAGGPDAAPASAPDSACRSASGFRPRRRSRRNDPKRGPRSWPEQQFVERREPAQRHARAARPGRLVSGLEFREGPAHIVDRVWIVSAPASGPSAAKRASRAWSAARSSASGARKRFCGFDEVVVVANGVMD